jgi:hypothetical protein
MPGSCRIDVADDDTGAPGPVAFPTAPMRVRTAFRHKSRGGREPTTPLNEEESE